MTTDTSKGEPPVAAKRSWRWALGSGALLLLAAAGLAGWAAWWWSPSAPPDPPMPPDIQDAEVRHAIERARQNVLDKPRSADAWGHLGMTLLAHLFDRDADRCLAEAARLDPRDPRWLYVRGIIALKRDPEHALPLLRQAAASADSRPEGRSAMRLQYAEALLERQQLDEAAALFGEEITRDPGNPRAALGLGLVAVAKGNDGEAEAHLKTARAAEYARKKATAQLAALAGARGDSIAAAKYAKETAALPDDPPWPDPILDEIMEFRVGHRRWEREVDELERGKRYAEAAAIYLQQIKEHPTSRAYVGAGMNLARLRDYDQALPLLRKGVQLDDESAQAHYSLALTLFTRAELERQQSPESAEAKEWLLEAVQEAQRTVQLKPDHADAYRFWGLSLKFLGESKAAVEPLRKAVACRPESFDLQLELGEALLDAGQEREAQTHLENAQRLQPENRRPAQALERLRSKKN
jgi:tetratricopeptide (TPR) repeat protein